MHDNPPPGSPFLEQFNLPPGDIKYIDVIAFSREKNGMIYPRILHATQGELGVLPAMSQTFTIKVRALDTPGVEEYFSINYAASQISIRPAPCALA